MKIHRLFHFFKICPYFHIFNSSLRLAIALLTAFFLFVFKAQIASAQSPAPFVLDPQKAITQYSHEIWQDDEGLPQSAVQAIVQTPDGYLWLGFEEGLARFDGVRFTLFHKGNTPELTYNDVPVLLVDRAGNLWIGTDGGGLVRYKDGKFTAFTTKEGLAGDVVESIYEDRQGILWIGTNRGLSQWRDGKFMTFTTQHGLSKNTVLSLCEDRAGNLWIGTNGGGLNCYRDGNFKVYTSKDGLANDVIWALLEDKSGSIWIGTNGGLHRLERGKFILYTTNDGLANNLVRTIFDDGAGSLWIGTRGGLSRWHKGNFTTFSTQQGLSNDFVQAICEDREGSLWIGTYGGGLNRLRDGNFTTYAISEGLASKMVWTIYEDKVGNLWVGTDRGLDRFKDGKFTRFIAPKGNGPNVVTALHEDRAGNLWIGTTGQGLYGWRNGIWTLFTEQNGLPSNFVRSVLEDRTGNLWFGTDRGLCRFKNGNFKTYTVKDGLSSDEVRGIIEDKNGALWIGTRTGGLNRFQNEKFIIYTTEDGLSSDLIRPIYEDQESTLWIGTNGGGLSRFKDGKFTRYSIKEGLFDDSIFQILEDDGGNLWMSCNKGIFRVSKQELNDFAEGKIKTIVCVAYGKADGMKTNECNGGAQPAGWRTRDGKLWFPTVAGVTMIDPANLRTNSLPPPVIVEQIVVDQKPLHLEDHLKLPARSRSLEFHYTGLSFLAPQKVQFKYKLDGYDEDWNNAGTRRVAYYTHLPSGDYTFHAMACNNDGVWNRAGATLSFTLLPHFYETKLFYFLCFLALVFSGFGALRWRERQIRAREKDAALRRANEDLERRVKERTTALEEAQNFLNSIIDHLPLMLFIKDAQNLRFVRFNRTGEKIIGLTAKEMLGKSDYDFFPKEQADFFTSKDRTVLSGGETVDIAEEPIQTPWGTRWLYTRKVPILGANGQSQYLLGLSEDITERKATEEALRKSEEQFRLLFDLASIGMAISGLDGRILRANQAFCQLLGYSSAELLTLNLKDVSHPDDIAAHFTLREQLLGGEIPSFQMEKRFIAKDGLILHVILQSSLVHDSQGKPLHFISQIIDITDRKKADEALRESEARFRQMAENIKSVFWLTDPDKNRMIYVSPAYEEIWGRSCASLYESPRNWLAAVHPEDLQRVYEAFLTQQISGQYDEIYRIQRPDGSLRWIRDRAFPVRDHNGTIYRIAGISEDITAIKQAEHEIRLLKEGLEKRVLERTAELRATNTALEREVTERRRAQEQLQYRVELEKLLANLSTQFINLPIDQIDQGINRVLQTLGEFMRVDRCYVFQLSASGSQLNNTHEWCAAGIDSQIQNKQGIDLDRLPWVKEKIARRETLNIPIVDELLQEAGAEKTFFQALGIRSLVEIPMISSNVCMGMIGFDMVHEERTWTEQVTTSLRIVAEIIANALERERAEKALQESESRFRQLAENISQVLWIESRDTGTLLYVSPIYEKIWGRACESLYEQPDSFLDSVYPEDVNRFKTHLRKQRRGEISEVEYRIIRSDQSIRWIRDRSFPIRDARGQAYRSAGVSEDITERKHLEEQIRQHSEELEEQVEQRTARIQELERQRAASDKLAVAGRMAARIAHEINNPLAGIQSSFQLIKGAVPANHRYYEYIGIIEREIERIAGIIRQMYDLYRPEKESVRQFRMDQTLGDIVALLKASSHEHGVTIECDINSAAGIVTLSEGLLRQVLFNLLQNAIEASPANSNVKVSARVEPKHLAITVADQGHGIPEKLRSQIFEPFFTTKNGQGGGLGLGLSVSKSIVEAMGGTIDFESQIGQGTVFKIDLPL